MTPSRRDISAAALGASVALGLSGRAFALTPSPLVIATGGSVGDWPACGQGAYETAIRDGADVIAIDVVPTRDGALVALRDHELSGETDVAGRPDFADRRQTRMVEGRERMGWFAEDFTVQELKSLTLGAPGSRRPPRGPPGVGRSILTFEEVIGVARRGSVRTARVVGVCATVLRSAYFARLDLAIEPRLATAIRVGGYNSPAAAMFVASPDMEALKTLAMLIRARRVLRMVGGPDVTTPENLAEIRRHADAVAIHPGRLIDLSNPRAMPPTGLVKDAHAAGLAVQAWTSGYDTVFPPPPFRPGDARRVMAALFTAGVDAVAGDLAGPIARARDDAGRADHG